MDLQVRRYSFPGFLEEAMGGDLWGTGDALPLKKWGGETAYASVSPIFREVGLVLLDAWQSTNWLKKGVMKECFGLK